MTVAETKKWVTEQIKETYNSMKAFEGNQNPQVKELHIRSSAQYEILDDLYYKLYKRYYKPIA